MAMNLDAVLRIAAKVVGLEDLGALQKGLVGAERAASEAKASFAAVVNSASWQAAGAAAAGFGVAIGLAARAAMDFESSMADVRKVVNGLESPKAFGEIKAEILNLSREMPIAAKGFAEIYAAAGQSGIARGELRDFAVTVAKVAVAFDMTAQEAGQSLAQIKVALGLTIPELTKLADAMNHISNNTGATAANLVEFMSRAGATGKLAGMTGQQTVAFGAAMIQTGIQADVAATSFNNMIKALSKGPSMSERQIAALQRMGYAMVNASEVESQLSRVAETESKKRVDTARNRGNETVRLAEEQSRRRMEVAKAETDALSREINRRYRNQLQALQDNWDDESTARENALQDQAEAQIKAIERERDAVIKSVQDQAKARGVDPTAQIDQISDIYDQRVEAVRDGVERQLTLERRSARDQQQVVRDRLQDQEDTERQAVERRQQALQEAEDRRIKAIKDAAAKRLADVQAAEAAVLEGARAAAKKTGEQLAAESAQGFSDRLQRDAVGTVKEVLGRIAALPKSQQISVLSDMFGDEARGLAPLLANLGELQRILGLAADEATYLTSVNREMEVRSATTANQLQLLNNKLEALKIAVGDNALGGLAKAARFLGELADRAANFAAANPALTTTLVVIGGIVSALVLAAPGILATITLLGSLKVAIAGLSIGATIAGWAAVALPVLTAIGGALKILGIVAAVAATGIITGLQVALAWITGTLLPGLIAVFSGPVGWTILAVAAVVAMVIAFRKPIGEFLKWLPGALLKGLLQIGTAYQNYVATPITKAWERVTKFIGDGVQFIRVAAETAWGRMAQTLRNVFRGVLQFIADRINQVSGLVNNLIRGFNNLSSKVNGPIIPFIPTVTVPAFAEGAVVGRKTLAYVGDGGEPEYIIPQSKMAAASERFLAGARGASVIPASSSSTATTSRQAAPVVNITTGPVLEFDGQRYVTLADFERGMRATADGVIGRIRTPAARRALGMI